MPKPFSRRLRLIFILLAMLAMPMNAFALAEVEGENSSFTLRGAVDLYGGYMRYPGPRILYPNQDEAAMATSFRLMADAYVGERIIFTFNGYQRLQRLGDAAQVLEDSQTPYRTTYLDYNWLDEASHVQAPIAVDTFSVKFLTDISDITIGRQPIGLTTNFIFTPNDFFYPFDTTAVDRTFRPGVDSLRIDFRLGELSEMNVVGALGYDEDNAPAYDNSAFLGRFSLNFAGFDWSGIGGKVDGRYIVGGSLTGELWTLGWRAEGHAAFPQDGEKDTYGQVAAGFDHRWENTMHLMMEYFYHGNGQSDKDDYFASLADPDARFDPWMGQHYIGAVLSGEATPIVILQGAIVMNVTDPSLMVSPAVTYYAADEVEVIATANIPIGRSPSKRLDISGFPRLLSEYGTYPYSLSIQTRFFF